MQTRILHRRLATYHIVFLLLASFFMVPLLSTRAVWDTNNMLILHQDATHECRMWGMIANALPHDVVLNDLISASSSLKVLGGSNRDGWGLVYYNDTTPVEKRGPLPANTDPNFDAAANELADSSAWVGVGHVRARSQGGLPPWGNPHPFVRYKGGKWWAFAHNGNVNKNILRSLIGPDYLAANPPTFGTNWNDDANIVDSDLYSLWVLKCIEANNWDVTLGVAQAIKEMGDAGESGASGANFLLTNGETLWGFRRANTLWYYQSVSSQYSTIASQPPDTSQPGWFQLSDYNFITIEKNNSGSVVADIRQNYSTAFLVDSEFSISGDDADLRSNGAGQDWYESRNDLPTLLFLDTSNVGGDTSKKAGFTANSTKNAYLTQEFGTPQTGIFTAQWDIYVDSILDISIDRAGLMLIGQSGSGGPNRYDADRFVYLAFNKTGGGTSGTMDLVAMNDFNTSTVVASGLSMKRWYTVRVEVNVPAGTYDVYVDGVFKATETRGAALSSLTHISFAQWNDGAGAFYVDNVFSPDVDRYKLTVNVNGSGSVGVVPGECSYAAGSAVTLTAEVDDDWVFSGWSDDVVSSANPVQVTMDGDKTVTARFVVSSNSNPFVNYVHVWGYPGELLDPAGSINSGQKVRIFTGVTDAETPSNQLTVTIRYKAQSDSVWTSTVTLWEPLYGGYWYHDWMVPGGVSSGLYDVIVEAYDGAGGFVSVTEVGEFNVVVSNADPVVTYVHVWGYPGGLLDPAGIINTGQAVRMFAGVVDAETSSDLLSVIISYKAQADSVWTNTSVLWEPLYGGYWCYDWIIPGGVSSGLYDVMVEASDGHGGFVSVTEYGQFNVVVSNADPVVNYVHVWGYPGGLLDPAGSIKSGEKVRIFTGVTDSMTPSDELTVTTRYKAQGDSVWTSTSALWEPLYGGYWYYDWLIPRGVSLGFYDVTVEVSNGNGGSASATEYGEFTVENADPIVVNYIHVWGYPGGLLDPAGTIKPGEAVRIFTSISDTETPSDQLTVTLKYKAQVDSVWTSTPALWEPLYGGYWYFDWVIPGGVSSGLYDVKVEASDADGGSVSVTEYGEFTVELIPVEYDDIVFDSNFETGNLKNVQFQSGDAVGNRLYTGEQNHTTVSGMDDKHWWFYFSMENVAGKTVTIILVNNEVADMSTRWGGMEPVYSFDNINWERLPLSNFAVDIAGCTFQMTVTLPSEQNKIWLAPLPPYTISIRDALFEEFKSSPYLDVTSLGATPGGQELKVATITDHAYSDSNKIKAYVIAMQHSTEVPGGWEADGMVRFLLSDDPTAQAIRRSYIFRIVPIVNVDGVYYGRSRYTPLRNGVQYDLNREWSKVVSTMQPEIRWVFNDIQAFQPSSFNDIHSTIGAEGPTPEDAVTYTWSTSDPTVVAFLNKIRDAGWPDTYRGTSPYACSQVHSRLGVVRSISWENPQDEFITDPGHKLTINDWREMGKAYAKGVYLDGGEVSYSASSEFAESDERWMDIPDQVYSSSFQESYDYSQATVGIQHSIVGETLNGALRTGVEQFFRGGEESLALGFVSF